MNLKYHPKGTESMSGFPTHSLFSSGARVMAWDSMMNNQLGDQEGWELTGYFQSPDPGVDW